MPITKREYAGIHPFPEMGQKVVLVVAPERADNRLSTLYNLAENNTVAVKENVLKNGLLYLNSVMQEGLVLTPALVDTTRLVVAGKSKELLSSLLDTYETNALICLENYLITKETSQEKVGDSVKTVIHDWIRVHWSIVSREDSLRITDTITSNMKVVGPGISSNVKGVDFKSKQHSGLIKYNAKDLYQKLFPWEDEVYRTYYLRSRKPLRETKKLLRSGEIDAAMKLIEEQIDISTRILSKIDPENPKKEERGLLITEAELLGRCYHDYAVCLELKGMLDDALVNSEMALSILNTPVYMLNELEYIADLKLLIEHREIRKTQLSLE